MENLDSFIQLAPPLLLPVVIKYIISGLTLSFQIPARLVPLIAMGIGGAIYPFIAKTGDVSFSVRYPDILNVLVGICIGAAASGVHTMIKTSSDNPKPPENNP